MEPATLRCSSGRPPHFSILTQSARPSAPPLRVAAYQNHPARPRPRYRPASRFRPLRDFGYKFQGIPFITHVERLHLPSQRFIKTDRPRIRHPDLHRLQPLLTQSRPVILHSLTCLHVCNMLQNEASVKQPFDQYQDFAQGCHTEICGQLINKTAKHDRLIAIQHNKLILTLRNKLIFLQRDELIADHDIPDRKTSSIFRATSIP